MKTIALITSSYDETADYLISKYTSNTIEFFRINIDKMEEYIFLVRNDGWQIVFNDKEISNKNIESIYYRKPEFPNLSIYEFKYRSLIKKDIYALITGIADSFEGTVLTRPSVLRMAENKILQLRYATDLGIRMPKSLITNSMDVSNEFILNDSIIKPLSTGKVDGEVYFTHMITGITRRIDKTPIYLQEYISKSYEVRITIVKEKVYTVKIECDDKVDWRKSYSTHRYSLIKCPHMVEEYCKKLMLKFGLKFSAIDFIVDTEGHWIFLEINPNGQWLWLEKSLNLDISSQIVHYLLAR